MSIPTNPYLNRAEMTVATMLANGYKVRDISKKLGVGQKAIEWRRMRIYRKLGFDRTQFNPVVLLTIWNAKHGMIKP